MHEGVKESISNVESIPRQIVRAVDGHASFIGNKGKKNLREHLKSEGLKFEKFSLSIDRCRPVLSFLDTLQSSVAITTKSSSQVRDGAGTLFKIHQNLLEKLKTNLEERLIGLSEQGLMLMLDQTYTFITNTELKSIPINVIRRMRGGIKDHICKFLGRKEICHVTQELPLGVRMQVWNLLMFYI